MSNRFDAIDLGAIPAPDVVETIDFEALLATRKADMKTRLAAILPDWDSTLESDPIVKLLEESTYREVTLRQRVNDAARAVLLGQSSGKDLDNIAARYKLKRQTIVAANNNAVPPKPAVMESDTALRSRIFLAFEALSVAGPEGAYSFHALSAHPLVKMVAIDSPEPGLVRVTVMAQTDNFLPTPEILDAVTAKLFDQDVRPLTDNVVVQSASRIEYRFRMTLEVYPGPDAEVVRQTAITELTAFIERQRRLGEPITIDGLYRAGRVDGVRRALCQEWDQESEFAAIIPASTEFADCLDFTVTVTEALA